MPEPRRQGLSSPFSSEEKARRRTAMVFGAGGQDGTYLSQFLESEGARVIKITRARVQADSDVQPPVNLADPSAVKMLVSSARPDEIYYLAAYHHSTQQGTDELSGLFDKSFEVHCTGYRNVLDAVAELRLPSRVFYAASALVFGYPEQCPQSETTPMSPVCAYGVTKAAGVGIGRVYRCERELYACAGILYNHESPLRRPVFVTRKIVRAVAEIVRGQRSTLQLGSLSARVDWGAAEDYVRAMVHILRLPGPGDYVTATGELHSVRDFAERAFAVAGLDYRNYVTEAPELVQRRVRSTPLCGDARRLRATGWQPEISFGTLIRRMVEAELKEG
jgi:GDPmannose 4,6-dehydratase